MGYPQTDPNPYQSPVDIQPNLGLDTNSRQAIVELLNVTLSDEILLATKTRSLQWNVHGAAFLELRRLFAAQYQQLCRLSEEMAERVQMLGGVACGSLQGYLKHSRLDEQPGEVPDMLRLLADHEAVIRFLREDARLCRDEVEDEGTRDLLISGLRAHEEMAWMLRSSIEIENGRYLSISMQNRER